MKDRYVLVSFCNIPEHTTSPLVVLQIDQRKGDLNSYAPVALGFPELVTTATGLTFADGKIFVLFTSRANKTYVAALNENDLGPLFYYELPEVKDGHSILAIDNCLYVVSTGTDEIVCYDIKEKSLENPQIIWRASDTKQDTHHINSIVEYDGDILLSGFGTKTGQLWSTATNGYIFNITSNSFLAERIHHPHSLSIRNGEIYYSDSHRNTFCKVGQSETIFDLQGYTRGISWLSDDLVCLATSMGRRVSKSTGLIGNAADPGELVGECGLLLGNIFKKKIVGKIDLSWFGPEIYDIVVLPDLQANLLALSNVSQRLERQAIQILSSELSTSIRQFQALRIERDQQVAQREQRLQEIFNSRGWKFVEQLRIWYQRLAPFGSTRDKLIQLGITAILIWRREGAKALFRQVSNKALKINMGMAKISSMIRRSSRGYVPLPRLSPVLRDKAKQIEASGFFDHEWYLRDNPEVRISRVNPVEHYLAVGLHNEKNPNPLFNTSIYVKSASQQVAPEDALLHFVESDRLFAPGAYRNAEVLLTAQQNYLKELNMECHADRRSIARKYAVFLQCGAGSIHREWLTENSRDWDLLVNHYDQTYLGNIPSEVEFRQSGKQPGTKFTAFHILLEKWLQFLASYEYILLLDDDIYIEEKDISRLFSIASDNDLDLAQASLSSDSYCAHPIFKNLENKGIRNLNAVEIMMPMLSRFAIEQGKHLFGQTISGWGLDMVMGKLCGAHGKAAVIDDVVAKHTKPINVEQGAFYKMLHRAYLYPEIELTHFQRLYGVGRTFHPVNR